MVSRDGDKVYIAEPEPESESATGWALESFQRTEVWLNAVLVTVAGCCTGVGFSRTAGLENWIIFLLWHLSWRRKLEFAKLHVHLSLSAFGDRSFFIEHISRDRGDDGAPKR